MRKSRGKVSGSVATSSSDDGSSSGSSSSSDDDDSDRQTSTPKQRKKRLSTALMAALHVSHQKLKDQGPDEADSKASIVTSPQDRQGQATSTGTSTRTPKSIRKSLQQSLKGLGNSITSRLKLDDESLTATKSRGSLRGNDDDGSYMSPPFTGKSNILGALSLSEELQAAQNNQTSNPSMFYNDIRLSPQDQKEPARRNSLDAHIMPLNDVQSTTASTASSNKKEFRFRRRGSAEGRSVNSSSISNGGAISSESSPLSRKSRQSLSSSELNYTGTDTTSETNMVSNKRPTKFNDRVERFLDELKVDYDNKEGSQQRVSSPTNESSFSNIEELTNNPNHEESLLFPEERSMEFSEDDWNPSVSHSMLMEDKLTAELLLSPRGGERRRSRKKQAEQKATSSKSTSEHRNKRNSKSQKPPRTASNNSKDSQSNGNQRSRSRSRRDHRTSSSSRKGVRSESSSRKRTSSMSGSRHSARASRTTGTSTTKLDSEKSRPSPRGSSPAPGPPPPPPPPPTIPPDEDIPFSTQKSAHSRTSKRSSTHSRPPMSPTPQTPRGGSKSGRKVLKVPLSAPARSSNNLSSGDLPLNDIRDGSKSPGRRRSSVERSSKSPSRRSGVRRSRSQSSRSPGRYRERSDRESRSPGRYRNERESKSPGRNRSPGRYRNERESKSPSRSRNRSPGRYQHERESKSPGRSRNQSPGRYRKERESKSPGRSRRSQMERKSPGRSRRSSRKVAPSIIPLPLTSEGEHRDRSPHRDRPQRDFTNALDLEGFSPRAHAPQKESIDDFSGNASSLPVLSLPNISSLVGSSDDDSQSLMTAELPILKTVRNWNAKHVPSRETAKRNSLLEYESQKSFGTSSSALHNSRRSVSASPHGSTRKLPNPKFRMSDASSRTQRTSRSYDRDVEADGSQGKSKSYHGR